MTAQQEIELPSDIANFGRPLRIHRASASSTVLLIYIAGAAFLLAAGFLVCVWFKAPVKKNDHVPQNTVLYVAGGMGLLGLVTCLGGWLASDRKSDRIEDGYLVYPHALVVLQKGVSNIVPWNEITALISPNGWGDYKITTRDGRNFPIKHAVKDYWNLIAMVSTRVTEHVIHPMRDALAAGQTVQFGPFEISRRFLGYKGKTLPWEKIAALEFQNGQAGRRLRIRAAGSLLPWCYANLDSFPNGVLFADLLRTVCPPQFMR